MGVRSGVQVSSFPHDPVQHCADCMCPSSHPSVSQGMFGMFPFQDHFFCSPDCMGHFMSHQPVCPRGADVFDGHSFVPCSGRDSQGVSCPDCDFFSRR